MTCTRSAQCAAQSAQHSRLTHVQPTALTHSAHLTWINHLALFCVARAVLLLSCHVASVLVSLLMKLESEIDESATDVAFGSGEGA